MNGKTNVNQATALADAKMKQVSKKFRTTGLVTGALSGLTYGIYTTLVLVAGYYSRCLAQWEFWQHRMSAPD